jgi:hypothetical protein
LHDNRFVKNEAERRIKAIFMDKIGFHERERELRVEEGKSGRE